MDSKKSLIEKYYPNINNDNAYDNSAQTTNIHSKSSMNRINPKVRGVLVH